MMIPESKNTEHLYVHVPFCRTICAYCDFCHTVYRSEIADRWLDALEYELGHKEISRKLKTIYLGGGTPTSLSSEQLNRLLSMLDAYREGVLEYTCEVNPETLDEEKAAVLASHGVNRVSMGFQTSDPSMLSLMNRHHSMKTTEEAVDILRRAGIDNLSLDLMYSLPGQTMEMLRTSVMDALSLKPQHMSLYSLTIEENTVFGRKGYEHLDEDTEADMYEMICTVLEEKGYIHYEISNFCLPGCESMHNTGYWLYNDFHGVSCGASGKEGTVRYDKERSLKNYIENPMDREEIPLSEEDLMFENVMMGLRLKEGMPLKMFAERYGRTFEEAFAGRYESLVAKGLLEFSGDRIRCTERGFGILNSVLVELL